MRNELIASSEVIKNELTAGANTANRVGSLFENLARNSALSIIEDVDLNLQNFLSFNEAVNYINERTISQSGDNVLTLTISVGTFISNDVELNNINFPVIIEGINNVISVVKPDSFIINNCNVTFKNIKFETTLEINESKVNFENCTISNSLEINFSKVIMKQSTFNTTIINNSKVNGDIIVINNKLKCFNSEVYFDQLELDNENQINDSAIESHKNSKVYINLLNINNSTNLLNDILIEGGSVETITFLRDNNIAIARIAKDSFFNPSNFYVNLPKIKYIPDLVYELVDIDHEWVLVFTNAGNTNIEVSPLFEGFTCKIVNDTNHKLSAVAIGLTEFLQTTPELDVHKSGFIGQIKNNKFYTTGWD